MIAQRAAILVFALLFCCNCTVYTNNERTGRETFMTWGDWNNPKRDIEQVQQPAPVEDGLPDIPLSPMAMESVNGKSGMMALADPFPPAARFGWRMKSGAMFWGKTLDHSTPGAVQGANANRGLRNILVYLGFAKAADVAAEGLKQATKRHKIDARSDNLETITDGKIDLERIKADTLQRLAELEAGLP